ncbi:mannitol dehydrogenase family protein [Microbacterium sp. A8/3-1]|uniref:Mannitol-1-phosphate 5-dehydrogenase n=1 Tax=Microbacterium sp. A8/3-1 TaxID=3160749 RepID=A0AAU7W2Z9_9MICO
MVQLSASALASLPPSVHVPTYDTARVRAGIVHFGVGGFHRAHQAMYLDRLLERGDTEWGICGVGVLPFDSAMRDALSAQDNLYTLVTKSPDGESRAQIVGSIVEYLFAPDDPGVVLAKLIDPATKIVSLTITEGGYSVDDATGAFDPRDEDTLADLAAPTGAEPRSVLGFLVAALRERRAAGTVPFTVMSCDNIQGNGHVARRAVLGFAEHQDVAFAAWIADNVAFPSSMVDRITPAMTDETRTDIAAEFGVEDLWPVRSESFEQWVLEDSFTAGRPALEDVGVQIVADVEPYELMKLRLLNASHQAMGYLGILAGVEFVHDVCTDPLFVEFLLGYMHEEAIPTLRPVPGIVLDEYCQPLISRFSSDAIRDTLARQVVDGSDRIAKFLVPVVRDRLSAGQSIDRCVLVIAAWSVFLEGRTESGEPTPMVDRRVEELRAHVRLELEHPGSLLDYAPVFGELGKDTRLREQFISARTALKNQGVRAVLSSLSRGQRVPKPPTPPATLRTTTR